MNYLSLFSGIEAATVAWRDLGFNPIGFSEIEPFPCAVLNHHYPQITNFGDVTQYENWVIKQTIDIIVGGSPCQSFSIAGLRKGFDDERGNLTLTYLKAISHFKPRWIVWENVPGILSHESGRTFGTFIGALAELGYGFAYRVLDAKYFGVPQQRRRVFLVGYLGDWQPPAEVLFERKSLPGDLDKSLKTKQKATTNTESRTGTEGIGFVKISYGGYTEGVGTLRYHGGDVGGGSETLVIHGTQNRATISGKAIVPPILANCGSKQWLGNQEAFSGDYFIAEKSACSLRGEIPIPRKLTPLECERLQGFPDNYTNIPYKNKLAPNTPRYKALGNSMAVPVMRWIGQRIKLAEAELL